MIGREELIRRQNMLGLSQHTLVDMIFDIGAKLERTQAELASYKAGVEVEGAIGGYNSILIGTKSNSTLLGQFDVGQRVRVLVMKKEGKDEL